MRELKDDLAAISTIFHTVDEEGYLLVRVDPNAADAIAEGLGVAVRRCYLEDRKLKKNRRQPGVSKSDLVKSKLPDPGSVMSGDFGEILTAFFQAAEELPLLVVEPKKWRLKQDRRKPAPHSDIVQFILRDWNDQTGSGASESDVIIRSEVKAKATTSTLYRPIEDALADSERDADGRLVKTLEWLKERATQGDLTTMSISQIKRFLNEAIDHPPFIRSYRAVAVICASLLENELEASADTIHSNSARESALVVIVVPDVKLRYEAAYRSALRSAAKQGGHNG